MNLNTFKEQYINKITTQKSNKNFIESDSYFIYNKNFAFVFNVTNKFWIGFANIIVFDFTKKIKYSKKIITLLPLKSINFNLQTCKKSALPYTHLNGDVVYRKNNCDIRFVNDGKNKKIYCNIENFYKKTKLEAYLTLPTSKLNKISSDIVFNAYGNVNINSANIKLIKTETTALSCHIRNTGVVLRK